MMCISTTGSRKHYERSAIRRWSWLRCQNRASFFKGNEPAFLERTKRLAANERIPSCDGIAAIRVGAERPLQTKLQALLPASRTRLPKIPMDLTLLDQENPQIGTL